MSGAAVVAVVVAGGGGAVLRAGVGRALTARGRGGAVATAVVNITGSFLLGLVTGADAGSPRTAAWVAVVGTGLCGGYTTFSTATVQTVRLLALHRWRAAAAAGLGTLVLTMGAAAAGIAVGGT